MQPDVVGVLLLSRQEAHLPWRQGEVQARRADVGVRDRAGLPSPGGTNESRRVGGTLHTARLFAHSLVVSTYVR